MKKLTTAIVAIIVAVTTVMCLTACGQSPEQKLQSFVESSEFQEQLDSLKTTFGSTLDIDVKADGEKLVYDFAYKTQIPEESLETVKPQLQSSFDAQASIFEDLANQMKKEVGIEDATVVINLNNADGTNIISFEYKATE